MRRWRLQWWALVVLAVFFVALTIQYVVERW